MLTYEERARALWQSLSLADKQRVHGFLTIDGSTGWKFDPDKIADLCESCPEIPFALRAMIVTDGRNAAPNESSDDCLTRLYVLFEHLENIARTISNRFGDDVPEGAYEQVKSRLSKGARLGGWKAVPISTIKQIIDLYAFNTTITPPDPAGAIGEETGQETLRMLWEAAKLWCAPRDCGRVQRLLSTVEKELTDNLKPIIKEEAVLADDAEVSVAALKRDLKTATSKTEHVSRQLETAKSPKKIQGLEMKFSILETKRRDLCQRLQVQEAKAKYLRWGGRPLGRFDPFDEIQKAILEPEETDDCTVDAQD